MEQGLMVWVEQMKKRILKVAAMAAAATLLLNSNVNAQTRVEPPATDPFVEPTIIRATCYLDTGTTASGVQTRHGIIATCPEWMQEGYCFEIWSVDEDGSIGEFLGYYEPKDTGAGIDTDGDGKGDSIQKGLSIDIWCADESEIAEWQSYGDYFYIYIVKGVG